MRGNPKSDSPRRQRVPKGRVVTFYSYKGGTGRSMALANVAWMLALSGERVLIIDWDLEAPGVHRYFHPFLDDKELTETEGLLDFVEEVAGRAAVTDGPLPEHEVDIIEYIKILSWPANSSLRWDSFGPFAGIDVLTAGKQGPAYGQKLSVFDWIDFYEKLGGRRLLNIARRQMQEVYDYILIDSRTGVSDTSGICTVEMPDLLVVCFTLNDQSIKGASGIAESVLSQRKLHRVSAVAAVKAKGVGAEASGSDVKSVSQSQAAKPERTITSADSTRRSPDDGAGLRIFPVPTRVEIVSERDKRQVALAFAQRKFAPFMDRLPRDYWLKVQLPYFPFYAFEEIPAVFGDPASDELSLSTPLRHLARYITDDPKLDLAPLDPDYDQAEKLRQEVLGWYLRKGDFSTTQDAVQLAQAIYDQCDQANRLLMRKVMLRLVQVVAGSAPSPVTVSLDEFEGPLDGMVKMLARSGLVQISGTSVYLADRKVVESWSLLQQWLREDNDFLLWRQKVAVSCRSWRDHNRDESALLRGALLKEAVEWLGARPDDLTRPEREFIVAGSKAGPEGTFSWRRVAAGLAFIAFCLAALGGWYFLDAERKKQSAAHAAAVITLAEQYADKDPLTATLLLAELPDYQAVESDRSFALKVAGNVMPENVLHSDGTLVRLEFSRDGKYMVGAGDHGAELWDAGTWKKIGVIGDKSRSLLSASFNGWVPSAAAQNGASGQVDKIVTTGADGLVQVWTLDNKLSAQLPAWPPAPSDPQRSYFSKCNYAKDEDVRRLRTVYARFAPDDKLLLVFQDAGNPKNELRSVLVDTEKGHCLDLYNPHGPAPAIFSPDGQVAVSLERLPKQDPKSIVVLHLPDWRFDLKNSPGIRAVYAVSENQLAIVSKKGLVQYLNLNSGDMGIFGAAIFTTPDISGDGNFVFDGRTLIPLDGRPSLRLTGQNGTIKSGAFDPSSTHLLTASNDQTVRIWPVKKDPPSPLASWPQIIAYLRKSTNVCFTAAERTKLLNESSDVAAKNAQRCEASHK